MCEGFLKLSYSIPPVNQAYFKHILPYKQELVISVPSYAGLRILGKIILIYQKNLIKSYYFDNVIKLNP
ncbi:hypothetical protein CE91St49_19160 [Emergencia timonensis]|nr:hypothetical protein CE91St48_19220 [Emergencia timonensis]BDF12569.1 hypothetical protein CE91St49_19160 [Emergencia timonensis]